MSRIDRKRLPDLCAVWELWPGNNRFFCNGRVMRGPASDDRWCLLTYLLLLGLPALTLIFTTDYLWNDLTPALPLLTVHCWIGTLGCALVVSLRDPGILPRKQVLLLLGGVPAELANEKNPSCRTCCIARPPASHHCRRCGNCVAQFDHHCSLLNNCIGARNYSYFLGFLVHLSALGMLLVVGAAYFIFAEGLQLDAVTSHAIVGVLGIALSFVTLLVLLLLLFHLSLCCSRSSTKACISKKAVKLLRPSMKKMFHPRMVVLTTVLQT